MNPIICPTQEQTQEKFEYYFDKFTQASTPEDREKVIKEYTDACFSDIEKGLKGSHD